ncbi:MAG: mechanosensitive ion channel family protein [Bacilli bacterium]
MEKKKNTTGSVMKIVVFSLIGIFIIIAVVSDLWLSTTAFGNFVNNTIGKFFNIVGLVVNHTMTIVESLVIIVFFWLLNKLFEYLVMPLVKKRNNRSTIWVIVKSIFKYLTSILAIFLVLSTWGVDTPTLLAGAGIVGLAISFGAQSLIEDVIAGLFIIFEKQFMIGDIIQVNSFRGKVTEIGIRTTSLEDLNGDILIVNNSDIRMIVNTSANLSPAICDISVSYDQDLKYIETVIKEALPQLKNNIPEIKEGPYYRGVQQLGESSVVLRIFAKVEETQKYQVVRDLNREMKLLFDRHNITIPFPQVVVHQETEKKGD